MKSLGTKLTVIIVGILSFSFVVLIASVLFVAHGYVTDGTLDTVYEATEKEAVSIEDWVGAQADALLTMSNTIDHMGMYSIGQLELYLETMIEEFPDIYAIYCAFPDNMAIFSDGWEPGEDWIATERPWYVNAAAMPGQVVYTEPYVDSDSAKLCVTISRMIPESGLVFAADIFIDTVAERVNAVRYGENGYAFLLDADDNILVHPNAAYAGELQGEDVVFQSFDTVSGSLYRGWQSRMLDMKSHYAQKDYDGKQKYFMARRLADTGWYLGGVVPVSQVRNASYALVTLAVVVALLILALTAFIMFFLIRSMVTRPVLEIRQAAAKLANGDTNIRFGRVETDEVGQLKTAFLRMVDGLRLQASALARLAKSDYSVHIDERSGDDVVARSINNMAAAQRSYIQDISAVMRRVEGGDLQAAVEMDYAGDFMPIKDSINHTVRTLRDIVKEMRLELAAMAEGDLSSKIEGDFPGDFVEVKSAFNTAVDKQKNYVSDISRAMEHLREGSLKVTLRAEYHGDFLPIRDSIHGMVELFHSYIAEISAALSDIAGKDFTRSINGRFKGDFREIQVSIDKISDSLSDVFGQINAAADHVSDGSEHVSGEAMTLAEGAMKQNVAIQELVGISGQIAEQAGDNADQANSAISLSEESIRGVERGSAQMDSLIAAIEEINETSGQIGKIIKTINSIAFQTNLLALNAAVEAARAGSAGKGFSVVADEVRNLANKTSDATKDIATLIANSIAAVEKGSAIANETAGSFGDIVGRTRKTAEIIAKIAEETKEQSVETLKINSGLDAILGVVTANSATSQEAASASQELSSQAQILKGLVDLFKLKRQHKK